MKVLFTGGRSWTDKESVRRLMNSLSRDTIILEGAAPGLDSIVHDLAIELGFAHRVRFPAQWRKLGKKAGPTRNQLMLDIAKPDLCFAFPMADSKGTIDMMVKTARANVPTFVIVKEMAS